MDPQLLATLLGEVKKGECSVNDAMEKLAGFPSDTIPQACIDKQRHLRTGIPEVIYGASKSAEQIANIAAAMIKTSSPVIATKVSPAKAAAAMERLPELSYYEDAQMLLANQPIIDPEKYNGKTLIISAGTSDMPIAEEARQTLLGLGHPVDKLYDTGVAGLHRLLENQKKLHQASTIIVVAGMEGALPSVVAGLVSCPVIGVPTSIGYGASFGGIAALLGMLNSCAPGVAVVNIDNGFGAACMAEAINRRQ